MEQVANRYGLLFSIKVIHPWFKNSICPYLTIEPDQVTKKLFVNLHLLYSYSLGELRVKARLKEAADTKNPQVDPKDTEKYHFTFLVKLSDYTFFDVTDIDVSGFPGEVLYFPHSAKSLKLKIDKCKVTDRLLNIDFEKGKTPHKVKIRSEDNIEILNKDLDKGTTSFRFDMLGSSSGLYSVVSTFGKAEQRQSMPFYYSPLLRKEPVLGVIHIHTETEPDIEKAVGNVFLLQFQTPKD